MQVQDRGQIERALVGGDLGQVPDPGHVRRRRRGKVTPDQVRCLTRRRVGLGQPPTPAFRAGHQVQLGHHRRDRVHADPPTRLPQLVGDPRRPVGAPVPGEQINDRRREGPPVGPPQGHIPVAPLVEPCLRHPQRPARDHVRDAVCGPLGGHETGEVHRRVASLTQRTTERLRTSRSMASSATSARSRTSSARSSGRCPGCLP